MDAQKLREVLKQGRLLFDGATGTYAAALSGWPMGPVELACVSVPEQVIALHKAYIKAGCEAIKTNTFAAHPGLAVPDETMQRRVVSAAVSAARRASHGKVIVFADIGPAPAGDGMVEAYIRMADMFLDEGISCFLFETMPSACGLAETAAHIRKRSPEAFIAVSFAADPSGFTRAGESAALLIAQMDTCDAVDAVGLNCICGAYHMRRLLSEIPKPKKLLIAMPNAGYPHEIDGRTYYDSDPAYYAQQVCACAEFGAKIVGGCCGTTPEHISRIAQTISRGEKTSHHTEMQLAEAVCDCPSRIKQKLDRGERAILVELDPPKNSSIRTFLDGAQQIAGAGADAITIADCPIGRARMDSCLLACKLKRELGIEALPHMTCRDRNVNATKALLLGLSMEGVHNVLAVTGDPVPASERDSVKSVFQFNSRVMARFVRSLSANGDTEPFFLCGALNVNAVNFDSELERAMDKEANGIEAFLTQPVLSEQAACNLERARAALGGRMLGGLFPVVSEKNARFLHSEVAGITVDDRVVRAYAELNREESERLAIKLCRDAARRVAPFVDGFYIMTPFQRVELVCEVIKAIQNL